MKKSFSLFLGALGLCFMILSCKTKKTGCEAYGENYIMKKTTDQTR